MHIHLLHHLKLNLKAKILIKNTPDKGNTKCKSPKARISLACLRKHENLCLRNMESEREGRMK